MTKVFKKLFDLIEVHFLVMIFIVLFLSIMIQIFFRYVLNNPLSWPYELSVYSYAWITFIGSGLATRYGKHVRCDLLYGKLSRKTQLVVDISFDILTNVVLGIIFLPCLHYTIFVYKIRASALGIPWTYLLLCFLIGTGLIFIHNSVRIYLLLRQFFEKKVIIGGVSRWH